MDVRDFTRELQALLRTEVAGLSSTQRLSVAREQLTLFERAQGLLGYGLGFVPMVPGRRPNDEALHPGLGSSESVALLNASNADHFTALYRLTHSGAPLSELPPGSALVASLSLLDRHGRIRSPVPGWENRIISESRLSERAWAMDFDVNETFAPLGAGKGPSHPFGFGSLFSERFRLELSLELDGESVCSDTLELEAFDLRQFGSLYARLASELLPKDVARQRATARADGELLTAYHPWFPVLCIGVEKANLYLKAIVADVTQQTRMLTDPAWLLRVGIYLEFLTCVGIFEAVKGDVDLLSPEERELFERAPELSEIRRRVDRGAWQEVWKLRGISLSRTPGLDSPVGVQNLLRKRAATLAFLEAHHRDLEHAIELAGPNLVNAQETWHRVFRDAERAVIRMKERAFPELASLHESVRRFVLWHRRGKLGGFSLPDFLAGPFGDQDGLYASACGQYRASMNAVARWARDRGLMEYTGAECIPSTASLLENHLGSSHGRLERLQKRDGYVGTLDIEECQEVDERLPVDEIHALITGIPLFQMLTADELADLAGRARPIALGHHERIIVQGNRGSSLFIVHEGELEVFSRDASTETVVATLGHGAIIGEMSFLTGADRSATVRATEGAIVVEICAADLRPIVEQRPAVLEELTRLMQIRQGLAQDQTPAHDLLEQITHAILAHAASAPPAADDGASERRRRG